MIDPLLCSAIIDPANTAAVCQAFQDAGLQPEFGDARPDLKGFGIGKTFLHQDSEVALFGHTLPSWMQRRGTCTAQGTGRALQHACFSAIQAGQIGKLVEWANEMLYGVGRVQLGKGVFGRACPWERACGGRGQPPCNDGCSGDLIAQAAHDFGWLPRGIYGSIDMTKPREDLAVTWSNSGTPQMLLSHPDICKASACMLAKSVDDVRDALAARYGVARCGTYATEGQRDANGAIVPQNISPGGHCEELAGVFIDIHGDLWFVEQQSWGKMGPQGGGTWKLADGREVVPAEGAAAVRPEAVAKYIKQGSIWILAASKNLPRDPNLKPSDLAV